MYGPPVDADLYDAVTAACDDNYAYSYLSQARQHGMVVEPFTHIAWRRLKENHGAMRAFAKGGYTLKEPVPYYPGRDGPVMRPEAQRLTYKGQ